MDNSLSTGPTVRGGRGIKYPESDGKPMGETGVHVDVMLAVLAMLRRHYSGNDRVAVLANMFLYYEEGDPRKVVCPDVFVTLNVPCKHKAPDFQALGRGQGPGPCHRDHLEEDPEGGPAQEVRSLPRRPPSSGVLPLRSSRGVPGAVASGLQID